MTKKSDKFNQILSALEEFRKANTEEKMRKKDYNPDRLGGILYEKLQKIGINLYGMFDSPEKVNKILSRCVSEESSTPFYTDQLYHALSGSSRKPYHDPRTDKLRESEEQASPTSTVIDLQLLANEIIGYQTGNHLDHSKDKLFGRHIEKEQLTKDEFIDILEEYNADKSIGKKMKYYYNGTFLSNDGNAIRLDDLTIKTITAAIGELEDMRAEKTMKNLHKKAQNNKPKS